MNLTTNPLRRFSPSAALWASAFVLLGLTIVQAGRLSSGWDNTAHADVSRVGDFTALTLSATSSEDLALVLDGRAEKLLVYRIKNRETLEMVRGYELPQLFQTAARIGAGRGK
ncbi:MAG: hypothetical protein ACK4WH_03990 [Phycisphaerales bacterium]